MGQTESSPPRFYRRNGRRVRAPPFPGRRNPVSPPARGEQRTRTSVPAATKKDRVPTDKELGRTARDPKPERRTPALGNAPAGTVLRREGERWWRRRGLNPRPPRCERGALPTELLPHLEAPYSPRSAPRCQKHFASRRRRKKENPRAAGECAARKPARRKVSRYRKPLFGKWREKPAKEISLIIRIDFC